MAENRLKKLHGLGQSVWLDNLSRNLLNSGQLKKWIDDGVTGITSNPTIFQKAISGSRDYDGSLRDLLSRGIRDDRELFFRLAVEDISRAADLLWPVYQSTAGRDGYVSIEVSPDLAYETGKTIGEAQKIFATIRKKNIMVKVPATRPGLPAIEALISAGVNVNVTLLFSVKRYEEVVQAFLQGLEMRVARGQSIQDVVSVASFFVSRVDTLVDKHLEKRLSSASAEAERKKIQGLLGKAAIANARIAYKKYRQIFSGTRFKALSGAQIQRILWGSTGTKNPAYPDVKYVDELIGAESINTLPEATLKAYMDHGKAQITIQDHIEDAEKLFPELRNLGIDIDSVTDELEKEGVALFADSFFLLLKEIGEKKKALLQNK